MSDELDLEELTSVADFSVPAIVADIEKAASGQEIFSVMEKFPKTQNKIGKGHTNNRVIDCLKKNSLLGEDYPKFYAKFTQPQVLHLNQVIKGIPTTNVQIIGDLKTAILNWGKKRDTPVPADTSGTSGTTVDSVAFLAHILVHESCQDTLTEIWNHPSPVERKTLLDDGAKNRKTVLWNKLLQIGEESVKADIENHIVANNIKYSSFGNKETIDKLKDINPSLGSFATGGDLRSMFVSYSNQYTTMLGRLEASGHCWYIFVIHFIFKKNLVFKNTSFSI